jgi:hypothetical protein
VAHVLGKLELAGLEVLAELHLGWVVCPCARWQLVGGW